MKRVYYSHSKLIYDTERETQERRLIQRRFGQTEIVDPNSEEFWSESRGLKYMTEDDIMGYCLTKVRSCDALVFSSMGDWIGKGVHSEVHSGIDSGLNVYFMHVYHDLILPFEGTLRQYNHDWKKKFALVDHEITDPRLEKDLQTAG